MPTMVATPELIMVLGPLREITEIRDAQGQLLGVFTPRAFVDEKRMNSLFDLQEAERVLAAERDAGRPLQEIWQGLIVKRFA